METEKKPNQKPFVVDYQQSGVKSLRGWSMFLLIVAIIVTPMCILSSITAETSDDEIILLSGAVIVITCIIGRSVLLALATIAESALYKQQLTIYERKNKDKSDLAINTTLSSESDNEKVERNG